MIQGSLRQPAGDAERYRTLLEINSALVSNLTREALFGTIAAALRRVVPFERSSCTTRNETCDGSSCWSPRCRRPTSSSGWRCRPASRRPRAAPACKRRRALLPRLAPPPWVPGTAST